MKTGDWKVRTGNELYIEVKNQLYRPVHMIVHALAQYYGIAAVSSRDQLTALRDQKHMSPEIANMLGQLLDVAGQLRMELQLQMGKEYEALKLRAPTNSDPAKDVQDLARQQVATGNQVQRVRSMIPYLKILAGLATAFAANKSPKGLHLRENPFTTSNPMRYQIGGCRATPGGRAGPESPACRPGPAQASGMATPSTSRRRRRVLMDFSGPHAHTGCAGRAIGPSRTRPATGSPSSSRPPGNACRR